MLDEEAMIESKYQSKKGWYNLKKKSEKLAQECDPNS